MEVSVAHCHKTIKHLKVSDAPQITWIGFGTFRTGWLKHFIQTLKQTGVKTIDVSLDRDTIVVQYQRGSFRLVSENVLGNVHAWQPFSQKKKAA